MQGPEGASAARGWQHAFAAPLPISSGASVQVTSVSAPVRAFVKRIVRRCPRAMRNALRFWCQTAKFFWANLLWRHIASVHVLPAQSGIEQQRISWWIVESQGRYQLFAPILLRRAMVSGRVCQFADAMDQGTYRHILMAEQFTTLFRMQSTALFCAAVSTLRPVWLSLCTQAGVSFFSPRC